MSRPGCKRRRYNEQWQCDACGLQWDVKDPDPPACLDAHDQHVAAMRELFPDEPDPPAAPVFKHGIGWI